jgi:hypothetical protein
VPPTFPSLHVFANGLDFDIQAGTAALTPASPQRPQRASQRQDQMIKRQLYGRPDFALPRHWILVS